MIRIALDSESPVPLFHQIAEALRYAIATGELRRGDRLPAIRDAAQGWGVNLHTVRKAYKALASEDLASIDGARGTTITASPGRENEEQLDRFLNRTLREARARFGISAGELARLVKDAAVPPPIRFRVYVVECSDAQCESHAREIADRWQVEALPWCLHQEGEPPPGCVVATYFHYNEIRRRWPHRLAEIRFVAIAPDPDLVSRVTAKRESRSRTRLLLCELDALQAEGASADISVLFPRDRFHIEHRIVEHANEGLAASERWDWILFTPRLWARLTPKERTAKCVTVIDYKIEDSDLEQLGRHQGWTPRTGSRRRSLLEAS